MKGCTGKIIFACGRGYTEVPQSAIKQVSVGDKLCVLNNETDPKRPEPIDDAKDSSCYSCPCKRKAKHKKDMFWHPDDLDSAGEPHGFPTGIAVRCAITELVQDDSQ